MAQSRQQIAFIISRLTIGDRVEVIWNRSGNRSTEVGKVWLPDGDDIFGLGPDLLDPDDPELINIKILKKAEVVVTEPPVGSVAVFIGTTPPNVVAIKRTKNGWVGFGSPATVPYRFVVAGFGPPVQVFAPGTPPGAPGINSLTPGDRQIAVASSLGSSGSSPIIDVQYRLVFKYPGERQQEDTGWESTEQTTGDFIIPGLQNGVSFTVFVRAVNQSGAGPSSAGLAATPFGIPDAPGRPTAVPGDTQVVLSWTAPNFNGGSPVTGYKIDKILGDNNDGWINVIEDTGSIATTYTVTGLTNGSLIGFRVSAINAAGVGPASSGSVGVTPGP